MAQWISALFVFCVLWTLTPSQSMTHTKNELGKYSAILNLRFVGNPHICVIQQFKNMEANATAWIVSVTKQECVRISISKFTTFTESTLCPYVVSCFCVDLIQASVHNGTGCFCQDGEHCRSYWRSVAQSFIPVVSCLFILVGEMSFCVNRLWSLPCLNFCMISFFVVLVMWSFWSNRFTLLKSGFVILVAL